PLFFELFDEIAGAARELIGQDYLDAHKEVAPLASAQGHPAPAHSQGLPMRDPGRDRERLFAVERLDLIFAPQERRGEFYRKLVHEVGALFFKARVRSDMDFDIEVAGWAARDSLARALEAYHLAALDAGGHGYLYLLLFAVDALAAAGDALLIGHL